MKCFRFLPLLVVVVFLFQENSSAAGVDTVSIYSASMKKEIKCVVIKPTGYKKKKRHFPVVYLLHGYSGSYSNWLLKVPQLKENADRLGIIIVCPDGGYSSWYMDSPLDSSMRYETHIVSEVIPFIDAHYRTIALPGARAVTGLSMGGHGGLFLGLRHPELFGACGSMSGGVDINTCRTKYDIAKRIGDTVVFAQNWKDYSVYYLVEKYRSTKQKIIFDCGTADFFYEPNRMLHEKLLKLNVAHDYIERPGKHDWAYWTNAVPYQLYFFSVFFNAGAATGNQ
jgi:S-formylglutathione hydrolase FrmB